MDSAVGIELTGARSTCRCVEPHFAISDHARSRGSVVADKTYKHNPPLDPFFVWGHQPQLARMLDDWATAWVVFVGKASGGGRFSMGRGNTCPTVRFCGVQVRFFSAS